MNGAQLTDRLIERGLDEGETARKRVLFDLVLEQFAGLSASRASAASGSVTT